MKLVQIFAVALLFIICLLTGCGTAEEPAVSDSLREQAIQVLKQNLQTLSKWEKVHAAEYLLWLSHPEGVEEVFIEENKLYGDQPQYRIGIWRVLAQAAATPEEKESWVGKILKAYRDVNGEDRVHAAEALAKLDIPILEKDQKLAEQIIAGKNSPLSLYTLWGAAISGTDSAQYGASDFLTLLSHDQEDTPLRSIAAYALRHLGGLTGEEWKFLAVMALSEPAGSKARIYLLSAAFVNVPEDSIASRTYSTIRKNLLQVKDSPNKAVQREVIAALAEQGGSADLPVLISLLNRDGLTGGNAENVRAEEIDRDVQSAAAYATLRIDRRQEYTLAPGDWAVTAAYLLGMLGIGFYYSRRNKSEKDFLLGGGKMNPVAVGLSLFATLLSSLSYLSYPGEMIKYGPVYFTGILAFPFVYYVVGWFLIPKFMKMNVTSAYEILEIKLGISVRMLATFFFLSLRFLWMATIIYVTVDIAILSVFNIDPSYTLIIGAALMVITIVYTSMGGLKAVVVTDVVQAGVLLGGALLTLVVVSFHFGSVTAWFPDQWPGHWGELKIGLDARERLTLGNAVLLGFIWQICTSGSDQMAIQRYLATKDIKSARRTFGVSLFTTFIAMSLLALVGLAMIAYFTSNPQFLPEGKNISMQADRLFPKFIVIGFPVGISGLVAAGILAAAMSSLSSGLNSSSSVISEDILKRFGKVHNKRNDELKQVRRISFSVGVLTLLLSIGISYVEGNLLGIIIKVVNLFVSPLFVLFFLALFVSYATARGTFIGGIASLAVAIAIAFYSFLGIEVLFIMPTSLLVGIVVGVLCSFIDHKFFGNQETAANRSIISNIEEVPEIEDVRFEKENDLH